MFLKINHIVDLHDARYAAAEGVHSITLCADRNHHHNLSESMIAEFISWLSGIEVLLDLGTDYEQISLCRKYNLGAQIRFSKDFSKIDFQPKIITYSIEEIRYLPQVSDNQYYEFIFPSFTQPKLVKEVSGFIGNKNIIIQADSMPEEYFSQLKPVGWAWENKLKLDNGLLDFDEFERIYQEVSAVSKIR
ncbi:MAG: hypothetical protein LC115_08480 [Bacteroidia bacterium]|nr:hypothetical protein [Bacteroidia bacterium]